MLKTIEMSAQEAEWFLLKQDMSEKSRDAKYIPTCLPEERTRVRKSKQQMTNENLDENSTQVWQRNVIQKYEDRPQDLEDLCLADSVAHYSYNGKTKRYDRKDRPQIIRYRHYSQVRVSSRHLAAVASILAIRSRCILLRGAARLYVFGTA